MSDRLSDRPAVFFDRDGVLNRSIVRDGRPYAPNSAEDFVIDSAAAEVVSRVKSAGYLAIVVTNQPDVKKGSLTRETMDEMHRRLKNAVALDDIYTCECLEDDSSCDCYKPRPGMLLEAARKWNIDLSRSVIVGDRWRDVGAGKAAGCRTVFIDRGYKKDKAPDSPDIVVRNLMAACEAILSEEGARAR